MMTTTSSLEREIWGTFEGDICWNKCRQRGPHTRTRLAFGGTHILHTCSQCFRTADPPVLMRIAIKVDDFIADRSK